MSSFEGIIPRNHPIHIVHTYNEFGDINGSSSSTNSNGIFSEPMKPIFDSNGNIIGCTSKNKNHKNLEFSYDSDKNIIGVFERLDDNSVKYLKLTNVSNDSFIIDN